MNRGLKKLWDRSKNATDDLFDHVGVTADQVFDDFRAVRGDYRRRLDELLDAWAADETAYQMFEGFLSVSGKGWEATTSYLRARSREMQSYLTKQVRLTPHLVGGIDGFLQVYLATPADRWTRSPRYRKGVGIGRVVGVVCAFTVFLPVTVGRAVISMLPGASRAARYLAEKWRSAKEQRQAGSGAPETAQACGPRGSSLARSVRGR
jgi:hypothetical protein